MSSTTNTTTTTTTSPSSTTSHPATTAATTSPYTPAQIAQYKSLLDRDGFVLIPSLLSPSELLTLRHAASRTVSRARTGHWPYIRTVPKQFPPWPSTPGPEGIWGVQHLLHPSLPVEEQKVYAHSYFTNKISHVIRGILGCNEEDMVLELYNMLVTPRALTQDELGPEDTNISDKSTATPTDANTSTATKGSSKPFTLRWHRDDIPATATAEEELARLAHPAHHAQWNLALYDDAALVVVPGSHRRARTDAERQADPFDGEAVESVSEPESASGSGTGNKPPTQTPKMPGQIPVRMAPGDVVFYNNNILHRGVYDRSAVRATLHGSVGVLAGGDTRARNVLQHGVGEWVDRMNLEGILDDGEEKRRAQRMRANLVGLGRGRRAVDVGFSLEG